MSSYCLLASIISGEKLAVNLVEQRLYLMSHFCLAAFKMTSFSLSFDSLIMICLDVDLLTSYLAVFLVSWMCRFMVSFLHI